MLRFRTLPIAALTVALALPAAAQAQAVDYPPAGNPGKGGSKVRKGKPKTFTVCKQRRCKHRTIGAAVRKARGGDTIKVSNGTYRESVNVTGPRYDGLRIVGNARNPRKVVLDGKRLRGAKAQNGVLINDADGVKVKGLYARNYKANGFFVVNADGYTLTKLVAGHTGVYGIYAFNSKGGTMSRSEAFENNDAGFYIGQTPPQAKPKRSIVSKVKSHTNVLGFSGTNMRYVTIKDSDFYNNGSGIVPNALDSEKFPPPDRNVISGNRIFWNNFNYYAGAPFTIPANGPAGLAGYPIGVGVLLFGSQNTVVERNQIFGNWLAGFGAIQQVQLLLEEDPKLKEASVLRGNTIRDNDFGLGGRDLNGRDMFYDGSGTTNCFAGNTTRSPNVPADNSTFAPCPGPASNTPSSAALQEGLSWVLGVSKSDPASFERFWIRHPHAARKGIAPLERFSKSATARAAATKTVKVADNFYAPKRLTVAKDTTIKWKWSNRNADSHDVYLSKKPKGVKRFQSAPAATFFTYKKKLKRAGTYKILCTFHENMTMRIDVTR
jgi:plastocyanin